MFSENVTFFVYIGYMSLAWGLVFAAALLLARFVKTWLINALVRTELLHCCKKFNICWSFHHLLIQCPHR